MSDALIPFKQSDVRTTDGFQNVVARLGNGADNQLMHGFYNLGTMMLTRNRLLLESMYRSNWLVGRGIDTIAEDMTRTTIEIFCASWGDDKIDIFQEYMKKFDVFDRLKDAVRWGSLYGGAIAVPLLDGEEFWQPLNFRRIAKDSFKGIRVYDRWTVFPSLEIIRELGVMEGYPLTYEIMEADGGRLGQQIHWTRAFRFIGIELPYWQRVYERFWGGSLLERWYDRLVAFDSATYGGANLLLKSYLRVYKVDGYRQIMAAGGVAEENLIKGMEYTRRFETNEGFTTIDKEDEFQTFNWSFSGMDQALHSFAEQLSGALQIPLVRLMGQKPSGFSSIGETEQQTYYDTINLKQENLLRPILNVLLPILCRSCFGEDLPSDFKFTFPSLWQLSDKGKSEVLNMDTDSIVKLFTTNLITQKEAKIALRTQAEVHGRFADISEGEDKYYKDLMFEDAKARLEAGINVSSDKGESPKSPVRIDTSNKQRQTSSPTGGTH